MCGPLQRCTLTRLAAVVVPHVLRESGHSIRVQLLPDLAGECLLRVQLLLRHPPFGFARVRWRRIGGTHPVGRRRPVLGNAVDGEGPGGDDRVQGKEGVCLQRFVLGVVSEERRQLGLDVLVVLERGLLVQVFVVEDEAGEGANDSRAQSLPDFREFDCRSEGASGRDECEREGTHGISPRHARRPTPWPWHR